MTAAMIRCLIDESADGPTNMARDEALLESALGGTATLRFYGWREPTVSLGYFQPLRDVQTHPRLTNLPVVRRSTGGSALVHHHELTYALALPPGLPWQRSGLNWLCRMHGFLSEALNELGANVQSCLCETAQKLGPVLCFLHQTPGDLLIERAKIVGSAQRRHRGALLQHGGILLAQSPFTPELPGLREQCGYVIDPVRLADRLVTVFVRETGWTFQPGEWTDLEREHVTHLCRTRYATEAWTRKR